MKPERLNMVLSRGESYLPPSGASVQVLELRGWLTFEQVEPLQQMFRRMDEEATDETIIDLSACNYIDSAGLAALVQALRRARKRKRRFVLAGVGPQVRNLLRLTRLDRVFEMQPALDPVLAN